jgi:hypothetical protein
MPYIKESNRQVLDSCINELIICLKSTLINEKISLRDLEKIKNEHVLDLSGNLNYTITRMCAGIIGEINYPKIAILTGVLENIKQEFYRRAASPYEDKKIIENGDVKEYKNKI